MSLCKTIDTIPAFCGETPHYTTDSNSIVWIDSGNPVLYIYHLDSGSISSKKLPAPLEGLIPREKEGWVAPTAHSILYLNEEFELEQEIKSLLPDRQQLAFHDCCAGPDGSLYIGCYDEVDYAASKGCIYRLNPELQFEQVAEKLALPNGSGFSPDEKTFYINEMMASRILAYDFDTSKGTFSNRRTFTEIAPEKGYPDGMTIDSEGCLWVALWQGFKIVKITPDGKIAEEIEMSVPSPTSMTFGGTDRKTLYITTAKKGLSEEQLTDYPESGLLFKLPVKAKGLGARTFKG
ncbi:MULTISPECIES: SMP-30/gluconolactonase/LRE family protein [unclassified Oceanispirochaeta]|uniref:SMP-30/gluconolactonase/LRE family protein n=1 Tax=unclassified Oceanispirochaeta TaxID=2635722 RepID=UPI000E096EB8|nr:MULTISPECIES: SMP-30/gluconolactonase/LRE family protein [unclassified Oceanispirochaeta]MBF9016682.1 SMP-30/gluconolactonase/LRE family protein [Oceanispirochaeta sp. M2]NPD73113.1 SMP-30/gluconolactonase/LRE family protein [Oceanispirochaeta sp. M1]RDG31214.1 SMP-30/gluconolactonase/LRE family protein [Oceanispirochaeta sp. M1]